MGNAISANSLIRQYKENSLRFYREYDGRKISVYGIVDDIKPSSEGGAKVIIGNQDGLFNQILCKLSPNKAYQAENISKGDNVVATGVIERRHGMYVNNIELSECKLK